MVNSFWEDRSVFVTGGTGLLGSRLVEDLVQLGADVTCLVRDWVPNSNFITKSLVDKVNLVRGQVQDQPLMERTLNEYETSTVFHLAAQTIVGTANRNPISTYESNIKGTWVLLESCRRSPIVSRIVCASSDKAYGIQNVLPYKEDAPLQGIYPYDVSKSCADLLAQSYFHTYNLPVCITRCGNLYGNGDLNWNRIIPGTIRSIIREKAPEIRSDGQSIRDYFHVRDASRAYIRLAEKMDDPKVKGEAFNFSNEAPISVIELVNLILKVMASDLVPVILNESKNEIPKQYLDASKASELLGWSPAYSLEAGLLETVSWYKELLADD